MDVTICYLINSRNVNIVFFIILEMSWLSGLAGKAEELLNKIDQNAASAFNKKTVSAKPVTEDSVLTEVTSLPYTDER